MHAKAQAPVVVMGLLDSASIAYAVGCRLAAAGRRVIYTFQNPLLKKRYWDHDATIDPVRRDAIEYRFCDVSEDDQVAALFNAFPSLAGVVHSLAYANPKTCLGAELHTDAVDDILKSYRISTVSLATVARLAVARMAPGGGALVALSFDSRHAYPYYNWMGVHKAALEALVRALARRHGRDGVAVNAVSAGPLMTSAASRIPGFDRLLETWSRRSPLSWDPVADKQAVAETVVFLLDAARHKITGQIITVDGGAAIVGADLLESERQPIDGAGVVTNGCQPSWIEP